MSSSWERQKRRESNLTPEQDEARLAYNREKEARRRARWTPEQVAEKKEITRRANAKYRAKQGRQPRLLVKDMTTEQLAERAERRRQQDRERAAALRTGKRVTAPRKPAPETDELKSKREKERLNTKLRTEAEIEKFLSVGEPIRGYSAFLQSAELRKAERLSA